MIKVWDLIDRFYISLNGRWGYIYGTSHEMWSASKQAAYVKEHTGDPDRENSCLYGGKWAGHWVTDCSGLFHYWFAQLGGKIAHGSNTIWSSYCSDKGTLSAGNRTDGKKLLPGTAVFTSKGDRHNHIGLYVGGGTVIEAQGAQTGVVTSKVANKKWTHWGTLKCVKYDDGGGETIVATAKVVLPAGRSGQTVNMREKASTSSGIVKRVPVGSTVDVYNDQGRWCFIGYDGVSGYMMSDYLEYGGDDETGGDGLTQDEIRKISECLSKISDCLSNIENATKGIQSWTNAIGSIVERG